MLESPSINQNPPIEQQNQKSMFISLPRQKLDSLLFKRDDRILKPIKISV